MRDVHTPPQGEAEWEKLRADLLHCTAGHCGMVMHLTNHYAPIYGFREFVGPAGEPRRQLLVREGSSKWHEEGLRTSPSSDLQS